MLRAVNLHNPLFINTLGHTCGLLLFGLFIVLLVKGWDKSEHRRRVASLIASCLAFAWNLGSLIGLGSSHANGQVAGLLVAMNFSVLSLLPAILFAVGLRGRRPWLARIGYVLGFSSVVLHFAEVQFPSAGLHEAALLLITVGFTVLIVASLALSFQKSDQGMSTVDVVCLFLFTLSFLHFGYGHSNTAWTNEVAWHHAGIPLALIVLLRDYRVLFLETFIRFVANLGLAALYALALYWAEKSGHVLERARGNAFGTGILLISFCFSLVVFAYLRSLMQRQLTRRVFRRGDLAMCSNRILQVCSESHSENEMLNRSAEELAGFAGVERFMVAGKPNETGIELPSWAEVDLPLQFSRGDSLHLLLGPRRGSRPYLSEDFAALTHLSMVLAAQVERFRTDELERLAREAELRALQAQINPHFLFNALNTLYGTIGRESFQARRLVLNLADLFRYSLQRDRTLIPLGEELAIVQAYLEIETLRLGDRLLAEVRADESAREIPIPILTIQPLVENAVKHGVSRRSTKGHVQVLVSASSGMLEVTVRDDGPGFEPEALKSGLGIALENVRRRLRLCYGLASDLKIDSTRQGTSVSFGIPLPTPEDAGSPLAEAQPQIYG